MHHLTDLAELVPVTLALYSLQICFWHLALYTAEFPVISCLSLLRMASFFSEASISAIDFTGICSPLALVVIFKGQKTDKVLLKCATLNIDVVSVLATLFSAAGSYCEWRGKAFDEGYVYNLAFHRSSETNGVNCK